MISKSKEYDELLAQIEQLKLMIVEAMATAGEKEANDDDSSLREYTSKMQSIEINANALFSECKILLSKCIAQDEGFLHEFDFT